jgi:hypothetical protein
MKPRDQQIISLRGSALGEPGFSQAESFQNQVLRPILKFQNDLLIEIFRKQISNHKIDFCAFSIEKKMQFIDTSIQRDSKFRNILKGLVIGMFTTEEYAAYLEDASEVNKRMMNMLSERLKSQLQLFEINP